MMRDIEQLFELILDTILDWLNVDSLLHISGLKQRTKNIYLACLIIATIMIILAVFIIIFT